MRAAVRIRDRDTLRAYLRLLRLSERGLAARAGIGHATVSHLLSGRRSTCSVPVARAIEDALNCPRGLFFERSVPDGLSAASTERPPARPRRSTTARSRS